MSSRKIDSADSLIKFLEYANASLWWFEEAYFWLLYAEPAVSQVENLLQVIDREKPDKIVVIRDNSIFTAIVVAVARSRNIPLQFLPPNPRLRASMAVNSLWLKLKPLVLRSGKQLSEFLRRTCLWLALLGKAPSQRHVGGGRKILLSSFGREMKGIDPATGRPTREDYLMAPIMKELRQDNTNEMVFMYKYPRFYRLLVPGEFLKDSRVTYTPWEYYMTPQLRRRFAQERKQLREKWQNLQQDETFQALFSYKGVNLWRAFEEPFGFLFLFSFPRIVEYLELAKRIVEVERPDILVMASESARGNKALTVAANSRGIPVLAVQHGTVVVSGDYVMDWACTPQELYGSPAKIAIFPTRLAIFGEDTLNTYREIGYPFEERLIITGQPRYDILVRAGEFFDKEKFRARFSLDSAKKLVLVASQAFRVSGNKEVFFTAVLQSLKDMAEIQVVIKPNPDEKGEWFERLAREVGVEALVLPGAISPNEALYACDVLITFFSTIALEAMMMGRPVVTVNLTGGADPLSFARSGAALGVYKAEDIAPAIRGVLTDSEVGQRLAEARKSYLEKQVYKLDGRASRRVADLVYSLTDKTAGQVSCVDNKYSQKIR